MTDELFLSQNDSRPMYLQIMAQIKQKVRVGDWPAGHPLPSIRELSAATKVSVITVKRAYTELEAEGVIVTQPGRGSFVADGDGLHSNLARLELNKHLNGLIESADAAGLNEGELIALVQAAIAARKQP
ncbi:GntR family transcriptional regulator [Cellvibrio zantedeschiae]|uniref:GntR family transcriptional regulator n=1 Tax=Cellvibrio zantedeschiae TaxID=1237077 RepID=A0ABQ3B8C4_9GAMM|nr:GntR family transcriptional regulator [Cellvibrio zantedeschiae]GGY83808.1 GntR family transcriptional regulator [Cellvibrio zantedeschiae]